MKKEFAKIIFPVICLLNGSLLLAAPNYSSLLKKWTRHDEVFVWENLEARMVWSATYLSGGFRDVRREKIADLYEWDPAKRAKAEEEDRAETKTYDVFFVGIYAGSSQWPEIGKDDGQWRIVLEAEGRDPVDAVDFQRIPITQLERTLYPYLDKWSNAYLLRFPKVIRGDEGFRLRMTGFPAKSELVWK